MFADEGDELLIGNTEYIVLNKYAEDGKEYLFVANIMNPEENIAHNFDSDAIKLLLLSKDEIIQNSNGDEYILKNFLNSYISDDSFEEDYTITSDATEYFTSYHSNDYENIDESYEETTQYFDVEKKYNFIERILEVMFFM